MLYMHANIISYKSIFQLEAYFCSSCPSCIMVSHHTFVDSFSNVVLINTVLQSFFHALFVMLNCLASSYMHTAIPILFSPPSFSVIFSSP